MSATHTPSPWTYREKDEYDLGQIIGADGSVVCGFGNCEPYANTAGEPPSETDLALMLAAPEAVRLLAKLLPHVGDGARMEDIERACDLVRVALRGSR